jgi:AcrR family transcriptional regulator
VSKNAKPVATRMPRVDAQRNRIRLLEAAKTLFAEKGLRASLDAIARTAGVGTGTFYRHFPTRDALIAAVYRNEIERLVAAAECLGRSHPPLTALREWLLLFVDFIATKHSLHEVLDTFVGGASNLYSTSSTHVRLAIETLVDRGVSEGVRKAADAFASNVLPIVRQIQAAGATTHRAIAQALNDRGVRTARGGDWHDSTVRNLLARAH